MSHFLLTFFYKELQQQQQQAPSSSPQSPSQPQQQQALLRPLTNSNFVCDFFRYKQSQYYKLITKYLRVQDQSAIIPNYEMVWWTAFLYFCVCVVVLLLTPISFRLFYHPFPML